MPAKNRSHYTAAYRVRSAQMRRAAYANPDQRCCFCGGRLHDRKPNDSWHVDHRNPGDPGSPLAIAHASCNTSAGASLGNRRRAMVGDHSVSWI